MYTMSTSALYNLEKIVLLLQFGRIMLLNGLLEHSESDIDSHH